MAYARSIVLGLVAAGLFLVTPASRVDASYDNLVGTVGSYLSPDVWEVQCPGGTDYLYVRTVPTYGNVFVATVVGLSPGTIYGTAVISDTFGVGGIGNEVYIDRPRDGRMKVLVTVQQTGGNSGSTYYVNLECAGANAQPKMLLLRDG